jgi:phosphoglycolate phosphatase-like HAD superfamily hydrolase
MITAQRRGMILALDFDGVICDSIVECMETSYQAFLVLNQGIRLPEKIPQEWKNIFCMRRGYVRPSGNFYMLWQWITESPNKIITFNQFENLCLNNKSVIEDFSELFHGIRSKKILDNKNLFIEQNKLFPDVKKNWPSSLENLIYIITTKDIESVKIIMDSAQLTCNGIYGRGSGPKSLSILKIAERNMVKPSDIIFVDDSVAHLEEVKITGCSTIHATWGYELNDSYYPGRRARSFNEAVIMVKNDKNWY